ncbi:MAG: aldolase [Cognatishimia sp.]|uniref:3-oxo-tetronate 4-phosphate decarboxylase n=1 Tax=Cognatishimia sp. TaxID=2211648 RepID=UPI003B8B1644
MSEEAQAREEICQLAKSLFDRGLTCGATGNLSMRLSDGNYLVTPTGSSMGFLDPANISLLGQRFQYISGDRPTKELPLHAAFYETRNQARAVVHLHSSYAVALSMLPGIDPDNAIPPVTPYAIMLLGKVKFLPFFVPGDAGMGEAVKALNGTRAAVLLANHGPVVSAKDLRSAVFASEELEEAAKLSLLTQRLSPTLLTEPQIKAVVSKFNVEW